MPAHYCAPAQTSSEGIRDMISHMHQPHWDKREDQMKKRKHVRLIYVWIAMLLAASFALQVPAYAAPEEERTRVFIQNSGQAKEDAVSVSGLSITLEEKQDEERQEYSAAGASDQAVEDSASIPGSAEEAAVVTQQGIRWKIPLFWTDEDNLPVQERLPGEEYKPVLAFFIPEAYAVRNDTENGFRVTLDAELSRLYREAGGAVCFYDMKTGITYIVAAGTDLEFLEGENGKMPAPPIPGLPDNLQKPTDGTYRNPSKHSDSAPADDEEKNVGHSGDEGQKADSPPQGLAGIGSVPGEKDSGNASDDSGGLDPIGNSDDLEESDPSETQEDSGAEEDSSQTEDPSCTDDDKDEEDQQGQNEQKEPLTKEQLLEHCADNTIKKYGEDEMAGLVDLIINCIQPQAVEFIKNNFPAFAKAAEEGELGKEIGLYVYRLYGDKDGVKAHADTSLLALAYVGYNISRDEQGKAEFGYVIGLNTFYFQYKDKDGNLHIDYSEQAAADLDNSIIHEMFHAFMFDYNRTGTIGTRNPEDYFKNKGELQDIRDAYEFPRWFTEGIASAVENVYQYRYAYFQLLRYEGNGRIGDRHTADNLLNTYLTTLFILEDDEEYEDSYDIGSGNPTTTSQYVTGYLADLYLGELAARQKYSTSSITTDDKGNKKVSSETIRLGLNSILERLHGGETLDQIICSISGGRYKSVKDFEENFIKGSSGTGDRDSIDFCVDFLNYMQDIGKNSTYIPNGSILFEFDRDFTTPIDRSITAESDIYRIVGSSDYVASTVEPLTPYIDGGKSEPGDRRNASREDSDADKENPLQAAKEDSGNSELNENSGDSKGRADLSEERKDTEDKGAASQPDETADSLSVRTAAGEPEPDADTADSSGETTIDMADSDAEAADTLVGAASGLSDEAAAGSSKTAASAAEGNGDPAKVQPGLVLSADQAADHADPDPAVTEKSSEPTEEADPVQETQ